MLKLYDWRGLTFQWQEGEQPADAVPHVHVEQQPPAPATMDAPAPESKPAPKRTRKTKAASR